MKRVICLYRVSTTGQVDHDDIPMQRIACHEYVSSHPDWEIVDEISEKGVSGYKVSTNARDAIVEIKKRAMQKQFDILLVFMFDRIGRRDDETPFVVQWFVQQGIEVWSTREGQQRFDSHVDKLLNYIRFWQASGESEKTAIRVRTRHAQMVQDGQYRGGLVPYGYRLENLGRTNKKDKPVPDLVIDEQEAAVVRQIVHLILEEGYGTHRVANWLNSHGIATKRGTTLWRDTSIRAMLANPIYKGILRFGDERSKVMENLIILDEATYDRCQQMIHSRAPSHRKDCHYPLRTDSRGLLSGMLYCGCSGTRLAFNHNCTTRTLADGTIRTYEREQYRCYRKLNSKTSCQGRSTYVSERINAAVLEDVQRLLARIQRLPTAAMFQAAQKCHQTVAQLAFQQAEATYLEVQAQMNALEEQAMKALTGQASLDIGMINAMVPRYRERLERAKQQMEEATASMEEENHARLHAEKDIQRLQSWAECFDHANMETKHMILAELIERIEVSGNYHLTIHYRMTVQQYLSPEIDLEKLIG